MEVKVNRTAVLEILEKNRLNHNKVVIEALAGYSEAMIKELEKRLDDAKNGRPVQTQWGLILPQDHTRDYDRVIKMFQMSQEDIILLDETDFASYIEDDWSWRRQWATANSAYTVSAVSYLDN